MPSRWKVEIVSPRAGRLPSSFFTRSRISAEALFVNVTATIESGAYPRCSIRCTIFLVITPVLPDPAPASTSRGPSWWVTAASCSGFRRIGEV